MNDFPKLLLVHCKYEVSPAQVREVEEVQPGRIIGSAEALPILCVSDFCE